MRTLIALLAVLGAAPAAATEFSGDLTITGQAGIGTTAPRARAHVQMHEEDLFAIRVSSPNGDALFVLDREGNLGLGLSAPEARVDVHGAADDNSIGLQLRVGNSSNAAAAVQIAFSAAGDAPMRHNIRTRHDAANDEYNRIEFYLWKDTEAVHDLGDLNVLNLSSASVHVLPFGAPEAELVVSSGTAMGGGYILCQAAVTSSSQEKKTDIAYLTPEDERRALRDVLGLRHIAFRYRKGELGADGRVHRIPDPSAPLQRGIIYEEAPVSVRGPAKTVVFDERLLNMEIALKEVRRRIKTVERKIEDLEAGQ